MIEGEANKLPRKSPVFKLNRRQDSMLGGGRNVECDRLKMGKIWKSIYGK